MSENKFSTLCQGMTTRARSERRRGRWCPFRWTCQWYSGQVAGLESHSSPPGPLLRSKSARISLHSLEPKAMASGVMASAPLTISVNLVDKWSSSDALGALGDSGHPCPHLQPQSSTLVLQIGLKCKIVSEESISLYKI